MSSRFGGPILAAVVGIASGKIRDQFRPTSFSLSTTGIYIFQPAIREEVHRRRDHEQGPATNPNSLPEDTSSNGRSNSSNSQSES